MEGKTAFVVFCIENPAIRLHENAAVVYNQSAKQRRVLYDCIIPNYEILSSQGKENIPDDLIDIVQEDGKDIHIQTVSGEDITIDAVVEIFSNVNSGGICKIVETQLLG